MADARPSLDVEFANFGEPAVVTPAGDIPVVTSVVRMSTPQFRHVGQDLVIDDLRPRFRIRRDHVPRLPSGSTIDAPRRPGGEVITFTVDRIEHYDDEVATAVVSEPLGEGAA